VGSVDLQDRRLEEEGDTDHHLVEKDHNTIDQWEEAETIHIVQDHTPDLALDLHSLHVEAARGRSHLDLDHHLQEGDTIVLSEVDGEDGAQAIVAIAVIVEAEAGDVGHEDVAEYDLQPAKLECNH
jgi:hypothetical protein